MHTPIRAILLSLCCFAPCYASAADDEATLADKFVLLLRYDEQYTKYRDQCASLQQSVSPEALVDRSPNYFGGIRPGNAKWKKVVAAYGRFYESACARPTQQEFTRALAFAYSRSLRSDQLAEAISFYSTPTGQALVAAHKTATASVYEAWTSINSRYLADLTSQFQSEIQAILASK